MDCLSILMSNISNEINYDYQLQFQEHDNVQFYEQLQLGYNINYRKQI